MSPDSVQANSFVYGVSEMDYNQEFLNNYRSTVLDTVSLPPCLEAQYTLLAC